MINAPGITISQAVVAIKDGAKGDLVDAINELEAKLRVQRNKPNKSLLIGRLGLKRSTKTGFPITHKKGEEQLDESTFAKRESNNTIQLCKKSFGESAPSNLISFIPFDVSKMTDKNEWIAIIHADGNGLGQVVQKIAKKVDDFKEFSHKLDKATINSANLIEYIPLQQGLRLIN
jgi:CRISPR-associated protein, TM1811 family